MIIDAHMHLPVGYSDFESQKAKLLSDMKSDSVDIGIVISDSELESEIGSMDDCVGLFTLNCPNVYIAAGISPHISCKEQLIKLRKHLAEGRVIAVKIYCGHEPIYIDDDALKPIYKTAREFFVPVMFHSGWDNAQFAAPDRVKTAARAYPDLRFVCCHCFYPEIELCFEELKELSNIYFDLSSIADNPAYIPAVKAALERFVPQMPERFVFGSDYAGCDRKSHIDLCMGLDLPVKYKEMLFCSNARRLYNI
ncbi:MAG: amidohydrolase [Oscillospiraceae bacterium]|nr:amidohydrolase [Oscillospiraceae bacterium]